GPRAHVAPEAAADGRAVDGARADPRRAQLRDHQAGARVGSRHAHRRAERERVAVDRRPRLRPLDRPAPAPTQGGGSARERRAAQGVPWTLRRSAPATPALPSGTWYLRYQVPRETVAMSLASWRAQFPIFERLTYINSCSQGALSHRVRAAYEDY